MDKGPIAERNPGSLGCSSRDRHNFNTETFGLILSRPTTITPGTRTDGYWAGWIYATDADTGVWKWRTKSNYPVLSAITPTAGGVVFFGDLGGNFYALDSATGQSLFHQVLGGGGGIGGGIITYSVDGTQKVAVAAGFTMVAWPTKPVTAKVIIFGVDGSASGGAPSAQ